MFYDDNDDELEDLRAEARYARRHHNKLARHPNCQDPDHPGCEACEGDADDSNDCSDQ